MYIKIEYIFGSTYLLNLNYFMIKNGEFIDLPKARFKIFFNLFFILDFLSLIKLF